MNFFYSYCVFLLALFGADAVVEHFDIISIRDPTKDYHNGVLTYFPEDMDGYVFYKGNIPIKSHIDTFIREFDDLAQHAEQELSILTMSEIEDRTQDDMYIIKYLKIKCYKYDDIGTVHIVYNNIELVLKFVKIAEPKEFVKILSDSVERKSNEDYQQILTNKNIRLAKVD